MNEAEGMGTETNLESENAAPESLVEEMLTEFDNEPDTSAENEICH